MKALIILITVIICILLIGCQSSKAKVVQEPVVTEEEIEPDYSQDLPETVLSDNITDSIVRFGFALYPKLNKSGENLFYSPLSISAALSMVASGADGETLTQMERALNIAMKGDKHHADYKALLQRLNKVKELESVNLSIANALFLNKNYSKDIEENYIRRIRDQYQGEYFSMSVSPAKAAADRVNNWVSDKTNRRIKSIVGENDMTDTLVMVILNSVYFKAEWKSIFKTNDTIDEMFYPAYGKQGKGEGVKVPLMYQKSYFPYAQVGDVKVLEMPYKGDEICMYFFLPEDMAEFENRFSADEFISMIGKLRITNKVMVHLPKFKQEMYYDLKPALQKLGMSLVFEEGKADFGGMLNASTKLELFISFVRHKTFIEVNEEGTEAAAVTAVGMMAAGMGRPSPETVDTFRADHPFIYAIVHKPTMSLLFLGKLANPKL